MKGTEITTRTIALGRAEFCLCTVVQQNRGAWNLRGIHNKEQDARICSIVGDFMKVADSFF